MVETYKGFYALGYKPKIEFVSKTVYKNIEEQFLELRMSLYK